MGTQALSGHLLHAGDRRRKDLRRRPAGGQGLLMCLDEKRASSFGSGRDLPERFPTISMGGSSASASILGRWEFARRRWSMGIGSIS